MKTLKIFMSETTSLDIRYVDLYQICQIMPLEPKMGSPQGQMFYIGSCRLNMKKSSCLKPQGIEDFQNLISMVTWGINWRWLLALIIFQRSLLK